MQNKKTKIFSIVLSVLVSAMLVAGAVMAATTIGTNITTTGTLSVTDTSTLTGATTVTGALYANGGLDRSGVAALTIGGTNASAVDISKTLITTTVKGLLNVDEAVTFDTTLGVTGISTLTGLLNADGGVAVDTTNFTVSGTTGAVHTAGDFDVATNKFTVAAASGNTLIAGTLDVTGVITGALTGNASTATSATSATSATTAANLAGGLANQIAYQTDAGATGFLTAGTDGQFLVANVAGLPVFVTMSGDVTTSNAGVTAIGALKVTNTMIAASTIDLTAKVTGVLPTANGGTGIAYFTAAGPTAARVYTFPDAAATIARTDAGQTFTGVNTMTSPIFITSERLERV